MTFNQIKKYPELLDIMMMSEYQRKKSLRAVFDRDITFNETFTFFSKQIHPTKANGKIDLENVFNHLITEDEEAPREDGGTYIRRVFEKDRAQRLHWIKPHVDQAIKETVHIFSVTERDRKKRKDVIRTYIFNSDANYVVVLEPQHSNIDYYLITAYYLNQDYAPKQMKNKMKKCLPEVY